MPNDVSKTKLLDALHGAMPSEQEASQTQVASKQKKALQGIVDLVAMGELDAETVGQPTQEDIKNSTDDNTVGTINRRGKTDDDKGEKK